MKSLKELIESRKDVAVVGLGVTGTACAEFFLRNGCRPICLESSTEDDFFRKSRQASAVQALRDSGALVSFNADQKAFPQELSQASVALLSPGISPKSTILSRIAETGIQTIGELELAIEASSLPAVVVTGSNGKSTVVSLIHKILSAAGMDSYLCGNIGDPVISKLPELAKQKRGILVVEASSYQLESCTRIKPRVGVFLNLSDNHLERHGSFDAYFEAKKKLFCNQDKTDFAVLNCDDAKGRAVADATEAQILCFGRDQSDDAVVEYEPSKALDKIVLQSSNEVYDLNGLKLLGLHNRFNIAASILACRALGVSKEIIQESILSFEGLEHRIELFHEANQISFINDSKSTTVASTCAAIRTVVEHYKGRKLIIVVGGAAKKSDWSPLRNTIEEYADKLRALIFFGADGDLIRAETGNAAIPKESTRCLAEICSVLKKHSQAGDVVLLSPACASFDEFSDFEERGRFFKSLIVNHF